MSVRRLVDVALLAYASIVAVLTLQPFEFEIPSVLRNRRFPEPTWAQDEGMRFRGAGAFGFEGPTPRVADAVREANAFYLYVEIRPSASRTEPARVVTYAESAGSPAFSLDQLGSDVLFHVADSHEPGAPRELRLDAGLDEDAWRAILVAITPETVYVAAGGRSERLTSPANLTTGWPRDARLAIGNAVDLSAPWRGELRRLVLGAESSDALVAAARAGVASTAVLPATTSTRLLDVAPGRPLPEGLRSTRAPLSGEIPHPWTLRPFVEPAHRRWARTDWTINSLLLVPIGALLAARRARPLTILGALLAISLGIELTQIFLPARHTQATDLVLNVAGGLVGAILAGSLRIPGVRGRDDRAPAGDGA